MSAHTVPSVSPYSPFPVYSANPYAQFTAVNASVNDLWVDTTRLLQQIESVKIDVPGLKAEWSRSDTKPVLPDPGKFPSITAPSPNALVAPRFSGSARVTNVQFPPQPTPPGINYPQAPSINVGTPPAIPPINDITVPAPPSLGVPVPPAFLSLNIRSFQSSPSVGSDVLDSADLPELPLYEPSAFKFERPADYSSALLTSLKNLVRERLAGGAGIPKEVEDLIWARGKDRETKNLLAAERDIFTEIDSFGFSLPPGSVAAMLDRTKREYFGKLSSLSRDISIKQVELEIDNLKTSIDQGVRLETVLIDQYDKQQRIIFDAAKTAAENAVQAYNSRVGAFNALLQKRSVFIEGLRLLIEEEKMRVEAYRAEMEAEGKKADINNSLVQQYRAQVDAALAQVKVYEAQISAATGQAEVEKAKLAASAEALRAYSAGVNAEMLKLEAYKAQLQGEEAKARIYQAQASGYAAVCSALSDRVKADLAVVQGEVEAFKGSVEAFNGQVAAEVARLEGHAKANMAAAEVYKARVQDTSARAEALIKAWDAEINHLNARNTFFLTAEKMNKEVMLAAQSLQQDAAKVAAQVRAQMAASAYGTISAVMSASNSLSASQSYSQSLVNSKNLNINAEAESTL